jgi:two-component system, chemotaxis family, sensor kinase CheA
MDDLMKDFLVETAEALAALDNDLVVLEAVPEDKTLIGGIFRTLHTVKGTSGFLGLPKLGRVAHAGENVLGRLRDGSMVATPDVISAILRCVDAIKHIVAVIETSGGEGDQEYTKLLDDLDMLYNSSPDSRVVPGAATSDPAKAMIDDFVAVPASGSIQPNTATSAQHKTSLPERPQPAVVAGQTIRVGIELLETLMTTVSELVLTRNQLLQMLRTEKDSVFNVPLQHLSLITSELQESVMKTRMQPIGNVWSTLPRLIRDLAHDLGKKIELAMDGAHTELDRQVLELIKDPLTHIIRNAADHGLEQPAERLAAGKDETGRVRLNAYHQGGHIIVQISDDGRGLDVERIRRKAVQNGLATEAELATMPDAQIFRFVLRPGFSTASAVTAVSGRGVGMDVVRVNVEKIGGMLDLESTPGHGACFTMKIPLTLAIVSALIVGCAGTRFAIPQMSVVELVHSSASGISRIQRIGETAVLRLRERLLPLITLHDLLRFEADKEESRDQVVIVIQVGAVRFGLVVDQVYDTEEIVVKPVAPVLSGINVYSGNTILGDGSVCMIIDPNGVIQHVCHAGAEAVENSVLGHDLVERPTDTGRQTLLLVRAGPGIRKAIPLDQIARLEEVDIGQICRSGGQMMVHYRDRLMSLVLASPDLQLRNAGKQPVLVFAEQPAEDRNGMSLDRRTRQIGLIVDEILDITESEASIEIDHGHSESLGSAIVAGEPTDVVNVAFYLRHDRAGTSDPGAVSPVQREDSEWLLDGGRYYSHSTAASS